MTPVVFALPGNEVLTSALATRLEWTLGDLEVRRFPDEETYLRVDTPVEGRPVVAVCTLDRPDAKIMPLLYLAATARDLGAVQIGLVSPYLAYMRQDRRFEPGEAVTSNVFGRLLSSWLDWLVTVDPHLHRHRSLAEVYDIPATALHAAPVIAAWIRDNVRAPLLVGPDSESAQWVAAVAADAEAPHIVLRKTRRGDRDVKVSVPDAHRWKARTPVLIDDIVSTARTMIETVTHLRAEGLQAPVCVGVHAVFAGDAHAALMAAGVSRVVTCNTIPHPSNDIDLTGLIADGICGMAS